MILEVIGNTVLAAIGNALAEAWESRVQVQELTQGPLRSPEVDDKLARLLCLSVTTAEEDNQALALAIVAVVVEVSVDVSAVVVDGKEETARTPIARQLVVVHSILVEVEVLVDEGLSPSVRLIVPGQTRDLVVEDHEVLTFVSRIPHPVLSGVGEPRWWKAWVED